ncbi:MAG: hypothetical protein EAS48_10460, partial [Chryseobacterium sp.]
AVHERQGTYTKASFNGHVCLVANPDIDLRLFMNAWLLTLGSWLLALGS